MRRDAPRRCASALQIKYAGPVEVASFPKLEACRASLLEQGERNATAWESAAALVATTKAATASSTEDSAIDVREAPGGACRGCG